MIKERIEDRMSRESYDSYLFPSGFRLIHYPKKDRFLKAAFLSVGFGSTDLKGQYRGQDFSLPEGVAHFLEHKLFEGEEDLFDRMTRLGASVNAFTSHDLTCYYFTSPINFKESLDLLLQIPINPQYTWEGIEREKDIISHEIKMYQDDIDYATFHRGLEYLYPQHPVGRDIAGSVGSIEGINKEVLDFAVKSYYVPSKMLLFLIGDFSEAEIASYIEGLPSFYIEKREVAKSLFVEDKSVTGHKRLKQYQNIPSSNFSYLVKLEPGLDKEKAFEESIYYTIFLDIIFGEASDFYRKHYESGDFSDFSASYSYGSGYSLLSFSGEARAPFLIEEALAELLKQPNRIDREKETRVKRRLMGRYLMGFNSLEGIASNFTFLYHRGINMFDYLPLMEKTRLNGRDSLFDGASCFSVTMKESL